jgi:uncharacterized protein YjbI with pentapeptide repeats
MVALIFTALAVRATGDQLQIAEQGQITGQYNAAITSLGSASEDVRLGAVYALQGLMQNAPKEQPTVVAVLCAYVRDHSAEITSKTTTEPTDIQAALTVVLARNRANDGSATVVNLSGANLTHATLFTPGSGNVHVEGANLPGAELAGVNLAGVNLTEANLYTADLTGANLDGATLLGANLAGANLDAANLDAANLLSANLTDAILVRANLDGANLDGANLTHANLTGARGVPARSGS